MKKLLTLFTLLLTVCSGAWATDVEIPLTNLKNFPLDYGLIKITNTENTSISSDALTVKKKTAKFCVSTKIDGVYLKSISFTDANPEKNGGFTCTDNESYMTGPTTNVYTYTAPNTTTTEANFQLIGDGGTAQIGTIIITVSTSDQVERLTGFSSISNNKIPFTSSAATTNVELSVPASNGVSVGSNRISIGSGGKHLIVSTKNDKVIKKIAIPRYQQPNYTVTGASDPEGTYSNDVWTPSASDVKSVDLTLTVTSTVNSQEIYVIYEDAAPTTPTLTGAWKIGGDVVTSASVVQGGSATMPTFTVGATSGTPTGSDYNVAYELKEGSTSGIFEFTDGVPTGINTTVTGSATVTATLTAVGTNYEAPTTNTFTYTVTVNAMLTQNSVSTSRTWDWSKLTAVSELTGSTTPTNAEDFVMANMDGVRYPDFNLGFNSNFTQEMAQEIVISKTQWVRRSGSGDTFQNGTIKMNFAVPGKLTVYFTGTSSSGQTDRYVVFNGSQGSVATANQTQKFETFDVVVGDNTISFEPGKPLRIQKLVFVEAVPVEVSALGYATFASDKALDFTDKSIKAYKATASGTEIEFEQVNIVPAGKGVLLYAAGGASIDVPVATAAAATAAADNFTDNKLVRGTGAPLTYGVGAEYYILSKEGNKVGFYKANGNVVSENKAYLDLTNTNAKSFALPGGETDGIRSIENSEFRIENSNYYNLAGQRVGKDYKGIVIVNGKKMLNK